MVKQQFQWVFLIPFLSWGLAEYRANASPALSPVLQNIQLDIAQLEESTEDETWVDESEDEEWVDETVDEEFTDEEVDDEWVEDNEEDVESEGEEWVDETVESEAEADEFTDDGVAEEWTEETESEEVIEEEWWADESEEELEADIYAELERDFDPDQEEWTAEELEADILEALSDTGDSEDALSEEALEGEIDEIPDEIEREEIQAAIREWNQQQEECNAQGAGLIADFDLDTDSWICVPESEFNKSQAIWPVKGLSFDFSSVKQASQYNRYAARAIRRRTADRIGHRLKNYS